MSTEGVGPAHRSQIVKPGIENEGSKQKVVDEEKMVTQHSEWLKLLQKLFDTQSLKQTAITTTPGH